jgi:ppGpp synthetase/RelA/SpoT-type nucleotidyltranferase
MVKLNTRYSKRQINAAGQTLRSSNDFEEHDAAIVIVNEWRAAHAFPLTTFRRILKKKAEKLDPDVLVAHRLKRLPTIIAKLRRMPNTSLSRLQDIGGCRAVVASTGQVVQLWQDFKRSKFKHTFKREKNYIANPPASGYRGIHLVYEYLNSKHAPYNGLQIEIQLRSKLQHSWATAVETVSVLTDQSLKSNEGSEKWLRFFALASSAFAYLEDTTLVPATPPSGRELREELVKARSRLKVDQTLFNYGRLIKTTEQKSVRHADLFLLSLNPKKKSLLVRGYQEGDSEIAAAEYALREKALSGVPGAQVVLVSAESVTSLRKAYPNYFLDTAYFVDRLDFAIKRLANPPPENQLRLPF